MQKLKSFFDKYNFLLAITISMLISISALWLNIYASILYLIVIVICSLFYDVNKMCVLCFVSVFGFQTMSIFGLLPFIISFTIICGKNIIRNKQRFDKTYIYPFFVFFIITVMFFSVGFKVEHFSTMAQVVIPIALSIEIYFLRKEFKLDKVFKYTCYLLIVLCCLSFMTLLMNTKAAIFYIDAKGVYRFRGFTSHENALAIFSSIYMAFYLLLYSKEKIGAIEFYLIELILLLFGILTKSKMFLILLVTLLICYFIKLFKNKWKNALIQLAALIIFVGAFCLIFPQKITELLHRFTDYFSESGFLNMITTGRVDIWMHYLQLWVATPVTIIFGIGGSYQDATINYSHNQYIEILSKYGVLGFVLIFSLIIYYVLVTRKKFRHKLENYISFIFIALISTMGLLDSGIAGVMLLAFSMLCIDYVGNMPKQKSTNNIPKIIHYIWFGDKQIPENIQQYINNWNEKLPNYKFILWNETNFDLKKAPLYVQQAYENKKFAFVADYVRLYALYNYGGIYLDTDVEVVKSFDELLDNEFFVGREDAVYVSTSIIGATKNNAIVKDLLDIYQNKKFIMDDGSFDLSTNVEMISKYLKENYDYDFVNNEQYFGECTIYKREYFSPKNYLTNKVIKTDESFSIHHFDGSWANQSKNKFKKGLVNFLTKMPVCLSNAIIDEYKKIRFMLKK